MRKRSSGISAYVEGLQLEADLKEVGYTVGYIAGTLSQLEDAMGGDSVVITARLPILN